MNRFLFLSLVATALPCMADPVISEFLASNVTGIQDEDGQRGDWIEVHNPDGAPVNMSGWHLTDKSGNLNKWTFPAVTIAPKGFLLVWATEKDRTDPAGPLHTNFKLDADGGATFVLAHREHGHPNVLETAGHDNGTLCLRWVGAKQPVHPTTRVVKHSDLSKELAT